MVPSAMSASSPKGADRAEFRKVKRELEAMKGNYSELESKYESVLTELKNVKEMSPSKVSRNSKSYKAPPPSLPKAEAPMTNEVQSEDVESKARLLELSVQVSSLSSRIIEMEEALIAADRREQAYQEREQMLRSVGTAGNVAVVRTKSVCPPCLPLPNSAESLQWLAALREGKDTPVTLWAANCASESTSTVAAAMPLGNTAVATSKKPRSEIPPPPPLPAGMTVDSALLAKLNLSQRRSSAPGVMETAAIQIQRRPSVFAQVSKEKKDLKPLYWSTMDINRVQGTIFENLTAKTDLSSRSGLKNELANLDARFGKKPPAVSSRAGALAALEVKPAAVVLPTIMDDKRKQMVGIALQGGFRGLAPKLRKAIASMDMEMLDQDRVRALLEIIPNEAECKHIQELREGNMLDEVFFANASKEELFFVEMSAVPGLRSRLLSMGIKMQLGGKIEELSANLDTILEAIPAVRDGANWKSFLHLCLETGNYLNSNNNQLSGAWGFSISEGFEKMISTKSCENGSKFTLMHWIADVAKTDMPEVFGLREDFAIVNAACSLNMKEMQSEYKNCRTMIDTVKAEVQRCKLTKDSSNFLEQMEPFTVEYLAIIDALGKRMEEAERESANLVKIHGENPATYSCNSLFVTVCEAVENFLRCHQENEDALKPAPVKANKATPNAKTSSVANNTATTTPKRPQDSLLMKDHQSEVKAAVTLKKKVAKA